MYLAGAHKIDQARNDGMVFEIYGLVATTPGEKYQVVKGMAVGVVQVFMTSGIWAKTVDENTGVFVFFEGVNVVNRNVRFHIQRYLLLPYR